MVIYVILSVIWYGTTTVSDIYKDYSNQIILSKNGVDTTVMVNHNVWINMDN